MKLNFNKVQGLTVPESFYALLTKELTVINPPQKLTNSMTINFRDPSYSPTKGGYHPVEIRLEKDINKWRLIYITDFSYQGSPFPELVKEIDVCFVTEKVFSLFGGWLDNKISKELLQPFIDNFMLYYSWDCYEVTVSFD